MQVLLIIGLVWLCRQKLMLTWGKAVLLSAVVGVGAPIIVVLAFSYLQVFVLLVGLVAGGWFLYTYLGGKREIKQWQQTDFPPFLAVAFRQLLLDTLDVGQVRYAEDLPYNRVNYFSSGSVMDQGLDDNFPLLFHAAPADNEMRFQEYGFLVTTMEVIIKKQRRSQNKNEKFTVEEHFLPFSGAYKVRQTDRELIVYYADRSTKRVGSLSATEKEFLFGVFEQAISSGWTKNINDMIGQVVVTEKEEALIHELEQQALFDDAVTSFEERRDRRLATQDATTAVLGSGIGQMPGEFQANQINDRFGGGQGHGHVGEQSGNVKDRLLGRHAVGKGADHSKNGADRVVNGVNVQTKYCVTPGKSVGQCFEGGAAKYINPDGSMMVIEVPKDQYPDSVKKMEQRIRNGEVPNEINPENASKYVKKGALTYDQSVIATKSIFDRGSQIEVRDGNGKVLKDSKGNPVIRNVTLGEKLVFSAGVDFMTGVSMALPTAVVTGVWVYCSSVWQGADQTEAAKNSAKAMVKPCLTMGAVYMVSSQFAGSKVGKKLGTRLLGEAASKVKKTKVITSGTMTTITAVITVGPDIVDCLRGRISMNQLIKNTAITGGGMAGGAAAGAAFGSVVPGAGTAIGAAVGSLIGGLGGSYVARKGLDRFIEDDAVKMIRIAKEEFIETVMMNGLSKEEFNAVLEETFLHKKFSKQLKEMFAASDPRAFIHAKYIDLVINNYAQRPIPDEQEMVALVQGQQLLLG